MKTRLFAAGFALFVGAALAGFFFLRGTEHPNKGTPTLDAEPTERSSPMTTRAPVHAEASSAAPGPAPPSDVAPAEHDYLTRLKDLRTTDRRAALAWIERGDAWYAPTGRAAEARSATRITVLVETGDMKRARRLTREFIERFPESPYRRLVQGQTGIHPRPGAPER